MVTLGNNPNRYEESWREIQIPSLAGSTEFPLNDISIISRPMILPTLILIQFKRIANLWFLALVILDLALREEGENHHYICLLSLLFLISFSVIKWLLNHNRRRLVNTEMNQTQYSVWNSNDFIKMKSKDLAVGHILTLHNGERAPADAIILATGTSDFTCNVEIGNLLGVSRLKEKRSVRETQRVIKTPLLDEAVTRIPRLQGLLMVSHPNESFDFFRGQIKLKGSPVAAPLFQENLILKDNIIYSTPWVFALVIYTGHETKSMKNCQSTYRVKTSDIERKLNHWAWATIGVVICLSVICSVLENVLAESETKGFFIELRNFILLFHTSLPIAMYVLLDLTRLIQALFIESKNLSESNVKVLNYDITDSYGQAEYIFTEKTGVLTSKACTVKNIVVGNEMYRSCLQHRNSACATLSTFNHECKQSKD